MIVNWASQVRRAAAHLKQDRRVLLVSEPGGGTQVAAEQLGHDLGIEREDCSMSLAEIPSTKTFLHNMEGYAGIPEPEHGLAIASYNKEEVELKNTTIKVDASSFDGSLSSRLTRLTKYLKRKKTNLFTFPDLDRILESEWSSFALLSTAILSAQAPLSIAIFVGDRSEYLSLNIKHTQSSRAYLTPIEM